MAWKTEYEDQKFGGVETESYATVSQLTIQPLEQRIVAVFNIYRNKTSKDNGKSPIDQVVLKIEPQEQIITEEVKDIDGNVVTPAVIIPSYIQLVGPGSPANSVYASIATLVYTISRKLPEFSNAVQI